jgi:lysophospholipase L1-like esterase
MERTIVLFGDSITAGAGVPPAERWPSLLEARLNAVATVPYRVIDAASPGDTTVTALARMDRDVVLRQPNLVMIQFGLNDAQYPANAVRPRVERGAFDANLRRVAQLLRERTRAIVTFLANHPLLGRSAYAQTTGGVGRPSAGARARFPREQHPRPARGAAAGPPGTGGEQPGLQFCHPPGRL